MSINPPVIPTTELPIALSKSRHTLPHPIHTSKTNPKAAMLPSSVEQLKTDPFHGGLGTAEGGASRGTPEESFPTRTQGEPSKHKLERLPRLRAVFCSTSPRAQ